MDEEGSYRSGSVEDNLRHVIIKTLEKEPNIMNTIHSVGGFYSEETFSSHDVSIWQ